jgi:spore coat-associated protein N
VLSRLEVAEDRGAEPRRPNAKRRAGAAGCIGAAALATAHAASASFTGSGTVNQAALTAGSVYLTAPSYSAAPVGGADTFVANRMQLAVTGLYPINPYRERVIDVKVAGNTNLASLSLASSTASPAADVADAATNGVGMLVDRCSTGWDEDNTDAANPTYTCSGSITTILGDENPYPFDTLANVTNDGATVTNDLTAGVLLTSNSINHLRFRFKLPSSSASATQGSSAVFTFTFDGTQRAGANK